MIPFEEGHKKWFLSFVEVSPAHNLCNLTSFPLVWTCIVISMTRYMINPSVFSHFTPRTIFQTLDINICKETFYLLFWILTWDFLHLHLLNNFSRVATLTRRWEWDSSHIFNWTNFITSGSRKLFVMPQSTIITIG